MNLWPTLAALLGLIVVVAVIASFAVKRKVGALQARDLYPEPGKESEADVVRLLHAGEKLMAIRCYRALHQVGLKEAKEAVELLERKTSQTPRTP